MSCDHFWLPHHGRFFRYVLCGRCQERRRVKWALVTDYASIPEALGDAIDRGVIPAEEVTWHGRRVR